jgi:hypothetical protein
MKQYTAIYSTETLKNIQYAFQAVDGNMAKRFCHEKFNTTDITIRDEETGEEFPLIDEWLSESAYVSRCMTSGRYHLYILNTWDGKHKTFAPVIGVTKELVPETIINEYNERESDKSTHKVGNWFVGFPKGEIEGHEFAFKNFCEKYGKLTFVAL